MSRVDLRSLSIMWIGIESMIDAEWEIKKLDRRILKLEAERQALEREWAKLLEEKVDADRLINEMLETLVNLTATHEL